MGKGKDHTQPESRVGSYHTRCRDYGDVERAAGDAALDAYGELYGKVQRKLFADVSAGRSATSLKSAYLEQHRIPARMFNGVRVSLEGKVSSVEEQQKLRVDGLAPIHRKDECVGVVNGLESAPGFGDNGF